VTDVESGHCLLHLLYHPEAMVAISILAIVVCATH